MPASRSRSRSNHALARHDHYQEVTDRIVAALEQGVLPWRCPWTPDRAGQSAIPRNATTGRRYNGINVLMLALSPLAWGTGDNRWCSYKQATERGWQVRRGAQGTRVFFFRKLELRDGEGAADASEGIGRTLPLLRGYTVFHASQMDGIPAEAPPAPPECTWRRPDAVDVIVRNSGANVLVGGSSAFYRAASDHIQMPRHEAFETAEGFASTMLHELGHWTGAPHRLDRDLSGRFGTAAYAEEELRAEIASAFMTAELGLPSELPNHASYISDWLSKLKDDKRAIFRAASAAQRIADYCLAFHPDWGDDAAADDQPEAEEAAVPSEPTPLAA